jgi:hypothetical protein
MKVQNSFMLWGGCDKVKKLALFNAIYINKVHKLFIQMIFHKTLSSTQELNVFLIH